MANNTLIRVVTVRKGKPPVPKDFTYKALTGKYYNRLEAMHQSIEVTELCLTSSGQSTIYDELTPVELGVLIDRFPHLKPKGELPPEPEPLKIKVTATKHDLSEPLSSEQILSLRENPIEVEFETNTSIAELDRSDWTAEDYRTLLENNGIKYDKRKKKIEYFIELTQTNNL